jgi:hypothetical protein
MGCRGREKLPKGSLRPEPMVSGAGDGTRTTSVVWSASSGGWDSSWPCVSDAVLLCAAWRARRRRACVTRAAWERMKLTLPAAGLTNWMIWNGSGVRLGRVCSAILSCPIVSVCLSWTKSGVMERLRELSQTPGTGAGRDPGTAGNIDAADHRRGVPSRPMSSI